MLTAKQITRHYRAVILAIILYIKTMGDTSWKHRHHFDQGAFVHGVMVRRIDPSWWTH